MNVLQDAIQKQEELLNCCHQDGTPLELIQNFIQQNQIAITLEELINPNDQEQMKALIYEKQQQIRIINKELQFTLHQNNQIKIPSECILEKLPPRLKQEQQFIIIFTKQLNEMKDCFQKLQQIPTIDQIRQPIKKQIGLLQLSENFKFELNCLESELLQNRVLLDQQYNIIKIKIEQVINYRPLQKIISFCTAISKAILLLKRQRLLAKQSLGFLENYKENKENQSPNKKSFSQESDSTNQQTPQKLIPQTIDVRDEACLCTIF